MRQDNAVNGVARQLEHTRSQRKPTILPPATDLVVEVCQLSHK